MTNSIGAVHLRRRKGTLEVQGMSTTPRGLRFIRKVVPMKAASPSVPTFKTDLAAAVEELLAEQ